LGSSLFSAYLDRMDVQHGSGLSPWAPKRDPEAERRAQRKRLMLLGVRYGVPGLIAFAGVVVLIAVPDPQVKWEIGGMFLGAAVAVLMINFFFRMGVSGDKDREREEQAREYFDRHGHWPDEAQ
jgi:hypothetical protein